MNVLVTGGAGFIGRHVVEKLLNDGQDVYVIDDCSNGRASNLEQLKHKIHFKQFLKGDIKDITTLHQLFEVKFDICYHLAASINVQDSIDQPRVTFENDVVGTFNILEKCRENNTKIVFMSTCMVYDRANDETGITEQHNTKPASPYAGSKIAGESMVLSYWHTYGLPAVVIRPFNTYGPFQKTGGEGGVVAIFVKNALQGNNLKIYGDGTQTRDLLFVEDCARFVVEAGYNENANGQIINAGSGVDITINELAKLVIVDEEKIEYVTHHHPQSEISKLLCNSKKAESLLNWKPSTSLAEGILKTKRWIAENMDIL